MRYWNTIVSEKNFATGNSEDESYICFIFCTETDYCFISSPSTLLARIEPSELENHRTSNQMLGPCCLCPMTDGALLDFIEAAIYREHSGMYVGEWVARCSRMRCGYMGKPLA